VTAPYGSPLGLFTGVPVYQSDLLRPLDVMTMRDPSSLPGDDGRVIVTGSVLYLAGRIELDAEVRAIVRRVMHPFGAEPVAGPGKARATGGSS
jgi:hypothetical protein